MQAPSDSAPGFSLQPRLRVFEGGRMVLGWGKIMLLRQVRETGSIAEAARRMEISYNHAWTLVRGMNESFRDPLVEASRGGRGRGGALITPAGETVLRLYQEMAAECLKATETQWKSLRGLLKPEAEGTGLE
ncbi:MAG: LysR family transcriptional regulator [Verrucomicrobiota bacterium]